MQHPPLDTSAHEPRCFQACGPLAALLPQAARTAAKARPANALATCCTPSHLRCPLSCHAPPGSRKPCNLAKHQPVEAHARCTHSQPLPCSAAVLLLRLAHGIHLSQRRPSRAQARGVQREVAQHERHHACTQRQSCLMGKVYTSPMCIPKDLPLHARQTRHFIFASICASGQFKSSQECFTQQVA